MSAWPQAGLELGASLELWCLALGIFLLSPVLVTGGKWRIRYLVVVLTVVLGGIPEKI